MTKEEIKAFKDKVDLNFIRNYCAETETRKAWYNAKAQETYPCAVFPKGADGKADKTQQPTTVNRPITFVQLKADFIKEFFPEYAGVKKEKKVNMYTPL